MKVIGKQVAMMRFLGAAGKTLLRFTIMKQEAHPTEAKAL